MLRSLFTGISGLRTHQTMMDVTSNNIANVNTAGFKSSQTVFQDTLSQALRGASAPTAGANAQGGTNPAQVGLGVRLAGITANFGQGSSQATGRATDLALQGDGLFLVDQGGERLYTRAGAFTFDQVGNLTTPDGAIVQGWVANAAGAIDPAAAPQDVQIDFEALQAGTPALEAFSIGQDGIVVGSFSDGSRRNLAQVAVATFINPLGLERVGGTNFRASANSGEAQVGPAGTEGRGLMQAGTLEMSNVDLAQEFTNLIVAQRGFQANSRVITSSDEILQDLVNLKR